MTQIQITRHLKIHSELVVNAIKKLSESIPSIKSKYVNGRLWNGAEFNLEETEAIFKELGANELQIIYMEENWKEPKLTDIYTIKGTQEFLKQFAENPKIQCCNTCSYLKGKASGLKMPKPYCSLYGKLLETFNAKVYEDYCSSYTYSNLQKPRQWFKESAPHNLNMYGEVNTINGIENDKLQAERKSNEPVKHVGQIGF